MLIKEPASTYHARTAHVSKGMLDLIARSPAHLRAAMDGAPSKSSQALEFGTAVHTAILEPDRLTIRPDINKRTKAGREEAAALAAATEGTDIVLVDEATHVRCLAARDGVMRHPTAKRLIDDGLAERTVLSEIDGIPARCRPDWYRPAAGLIVDLKTTADASPDAFAKSVLNYRYHVQHAWYVDVCRAAGLEVSAFVFVAVESAPPYCCAVYVLDPETADLGRRTYQHDLATYRRCLEASTWPGYSEHIEVLRLPPWAARNATRNTEEF